MTDSFHDAQNKLFNNLSTHDSSSDEATTIIKNLKTLGEAQKLFEPTPIPELEPKGVKGFLHRNSTDLVRVGGTITAIVLVGLVETKFDVIFRSKASKFI